MNSVNVESGGERWIAILVKSGWPLPIQEAGFSLCPMIAGGAASDVLASRAWIDCRRPGKRLVRFGDRFGIMPEKFAQLLAHEREGVPSRRCMKRSAAIVAATAQATGARDGADRIRCGSSPNVLNRG